MAQPSALQGLRTLARRYKKFNAADPLTQCLAPRLIRGFASHTAIPLTELANGETTSNPQVQNSTSVKLHNTSPSRVLTTVYSWPDLEPQNFAFYPSEYLDMPLRRDILHRAVVYEANAARQGSASTKWRDEVRGSGRKVRPQKGSGRARLGDKKSPSIKGGGVAFGPKPRDFSTDLPRKVYDLAFRIALSYRYKKGELIVLNNEIEHPEDVGPRWLLNVINQNRWGREHGRSLVITQEIRSPQPNFYQQWEIEYGAERDHAINEEAEHWKAQIDGVSQAELESKPEAEVDTDSETNLATKQGSSIDQQPSSNDLRQKLSEQRDAALAQQHRHYKDLMVKYVAKQQREYQRSKQDKDQRRFDMAKELADEFSLKKLEDVTVKDLLGSGRVVMEKKALDILLAAHTSDLRQNSIQHQVSQSWATKQYERSV